MMTASSSSSFFNDSRVVIPLMPGIITSTMVASNGMLRASSMPSSPLAARRTEYPSPFNRVSRISRMISSSSTTRIEPFFCIFSPLISGRTWARGRDRCRQRHREPRALPHRALACQRAFVLADDTVSNGQAEAGPLSDHLRREERVVDAREVFARDARARVADYRNDLTTVETRFYREPPALRHRVTRVQKQIEKDLLQLVLDAGDERRRRTQLPPHFHLADEELGLEQRKDIADDSVEIDRTSVFRVRGTRTGKVEQPIDDLGCPER